MLVWGGVDAVGIIAVWGDLRRRFGCRSNKGRSDSCSEAELSPEHRHLHSRWILYVLSKKTHQICTWERLPVHTHTHTLEYVFHAILTQELLSASWCLAGLLQVPRHLHTSNLLIADKTQ